MRITGEREDAEEAVQDAFLSVIRKIDTFRGDSAFGSCLYRIEANAAYRRLQERVWVGAPISRWTTCFPRLTGTADTSRPLRTGRRPSRTRPSRRSFGW